MSADLDGHPPIDPDLAHSPWAPVLRWLVGILATVALIGSVLHVASEIMTWRADPDFWQDPLAAANQVILVLAGPAFAALALLIVWFTEAEPGPLYGGLFLTAYSLWGVAVGSWYRESVLLVAFVTACDWVAHGAAIRFSQVFPRPLIAADLTTSGQGRVRGGLARFFAHLLRPAVFWPSFLGMELIVRFSPDFQIYLAHVLIVCAVALRYFYASYRTGTEEARQKVFWLMEAAVVFLSFELIQHSLRAFDALGIFDLDLGFWFAWTHVGQTWLALLCFALAIFYRGAFDSRLVLRRTTVASTSGAVAVLIFITLETAVSETLTAFVGAESRIGTVVAGVVVALVLRPVSDRIDRRFGGSQGPAH